MGEFGSLAMVSEGPLSPDGEEWPACGEGMLTPGREAWAAIVFGSCFAKMFGALCRLKGSGNFVPQFLIS